MKRLLFSLCGIIWACSLSDTPHPPTEPPDEATARFTEIGWTQCRIGSREIPPQDCNASVTTQDSLYTNTIYVLSPIAWEVIPPQVTQLWVAIRWQAAWCGGNCVFNDLFGPYAAGETRDSLWGVFSDPVPHEFEFRILDAQGLSLGDTLFTIAFRNPPGEPVADVADWPSELPTWLRGGR